MAVWKEFTGSDEQINEMVCAENGWIVRFKDGQETKIEFGEYPENFSIVQNKGLIKEYLICDPHPHAAMIKRWVETGQPVYCRHQYISDEWAFVRDPSWNPKWEYSFNPPQEKKFIEVMDYLIKRGGNYVLLTANKSCNEYPEIIQNHPDFVRWVDNDWRKIDITGTQND